MKPLLLTALAWFAAIAVPFRAASAETHVLVLGDSHSTMTFGQTLDRFLRDQVKGALVETHAYSSASTQYYKTGESSHGGFFVRDESGKVTKSTDRQREAPTSKLKDLLRAKPRDVVVVALGSNQLGWGDKPQYTRILDMIKTITDAKSRCIWVGPPAVHPDVRPGKKKSAWSEADVLRLYASLKELARATGCALISSLEFEYPPYAGDPKRWDGMHFDRLGAPGREIGRKWAEKVGRDVVSLIAERR